jgi:hypothetical protein
MQSSIPLVMTAGVFRAAASKLTERHLHGFVPENTFDLARHFLFVPLKLLQHNPFVSGTAKTRRRWMGNQNRFRENEIDHSERELRRLNLEASIRAVSIRRRLWGRLAIEPTRTPTHQA